MSRNVLLVEGQDDLHAIGNLSEYHLLRAFLDLKDKQGIENLIATLGVELKASGLSRLAIVIDADADAIANWHALRGKLTASGVVGLPDEPESGGIVVPSSGSTPPIGVWVMPDNAGVGMLEDFAKMLVPPGDSLWDHAEHSVNTFPCLPPFKAIHRSKAVLHTWLAWQSTPGIKMGAAVTRRILRHDAPIALSLIDWLRRWLTA